MIAKTKKRFPLQRPDRPTLAAGLLQCAGVVVFGTAAAAQQNVGTINGVIVDETGAAIPRSHIVILQGEKTVRKLDADAIGQLHLAPLKSGHYVLQAAADGFGVVQQPFDVPFTTNPLKIVLRVAAVADVNVSANAQELQLTTDPDNNQSAIDIDRDALDRLPVFDADYITTLSRFLSADATGTNGVTLVVNGVESNGPGVSASGIQSIRINQNPYTALYSSPGRARLEITTKGGTDRFHGSGNFLFRNSIFDASEPFASSKPQQQRVYLEGALTGPLSPVLRVGHGSTFLLTGNHDSNRQQAIVLAATPNGQAQTNVENPTTHDFYSGRAFHTFRGTDLFWLGYSYERRVVRNGGVGGTVLPEAGTDAHSFEHEINVGYTSVLSSRMVNQLRFLVGKADNRTDSITALPGIVVSGSFTGGGAQADLHRSENHFDGQDFITYSRGKHEVKFGIDVPDISRRAYDDNTNDLGTYTFANLAAYAAKTPSLYLVQQGQPRVTFWEKVVAGYVEDTYRARPNLSLSLGLRYYFQNYFHDDTNNLAPRFSFAYAPAARGRLILRGGAGLFYDRSGPQPISDLLHYNGSLLRRYVVSSPAYPYSAPSLGLLPVSEVVLDGRTRIPSTLQFSFGAEEQLTKKSTLSASWVSTRGMNLFRSIDSNAPIGPAYASRPNASLGQLRTLQSEGHLHSDSLDLSFRGRPSSWFSGQAQYALSKTYSDTQGITYFPADSRNPAADRARSDNDRRHKFDLLGTATAKSWFSLGTALSVYSGRPVNITTGSDNNRDGVVVDRPAGVARNSLHGPGYFNLDLNLTHDVHLGADAKTAPTLAISLNSFNVLNHLNPVTYVGVQGSPFFGRAVQGQPGRRMQLNLELKF